MRPDSSKLLPQVYVPAHNARFTRPAALPESAFVPVSDATSLRDILLCPGGTDRRPRQHRELQPAQAAAAGKSVAPPLCQGARDRSRISGRHTRNLPWTAVYRPLRRLRPGDRRPDPAQPGLVLAAVKAWPGRTGARRTRGATASLDRVSTPGQQQATGRDEETGFQVEQRNWTPLGAGSALTNTENGAEGHSASPRPATTKSGQMMCYENRTTSKATDRAFNAHPDHPAVAYLLRLHADIGGQILENKKQATRARARHEACRGRDPDV